MHAASHRLDLGAVASDLDVVRLPDRSPEVKDPNVVRRPDGGWTMYASVGRSDDQRWRVGRFFADGLDGPWWEATAAELRGVEGHCACAPAVVIEDDDTYTMYLQTGCFEPGHHIVTLRSASGHTFHYAGPAVLPHDGHALLYDAGCRQVTHRGRRLRVLLYTACDRPGRGDVWGVALDETRPGDGWSPPRRVLAETEVPFHNQPDCPHREWALEGAEVVQLDAGLFLLVGVCFLQSGTPGTRQRVFFAAAREPLGAYVPVGCPIEPATGENGHPSAVVDGGTLHLFHQARAGDDPHPWHLRKALVPLAAVRGAMLAALDRAGA